MGIASFLRACFRTSKPASPDATSAPPQSRPSSTDEDTPLRSKRKGSLSAIVGQNNSLLGTKGGISGHAGLSEQLQKALNPASLSVELPQRPSGLLVPDAQDIRSPSGGVLRTPLPQTPLTLSSPSLPSPSLPSGSPSLHILRTPMPFGSPVPYPHNPDRIPSPDVPTAASAAGGPHGMQPGNRGIPCLPYTMPFEIRQQGLRASVSTLAPGSKSSMTGADTAQNSPSQTQLKTPFAELSNPIQAQLEECDTVTPEPFKYKVSSQGQGKTPRVSGIENPATSYKENKAVIPRHTPFAERVDQAVAKENAFRASLSGHKRSGLGKAS